MTPADLFTVLAHGLGDYDDTTLLMQLLQVSADTTPFRTSVRELEESLCGVLNRRRIQRSTTRLVGRGLLRVRVHPNKWSEFTVSTAAIHNVLEATLKARGKLPGAPGTTIHFLSSGQLATS